MIYLRMYEREREGHCYVVMVSADRKMILSFRIAEIVSEVRPSVCLSVPVCPHSCTVWKSQFAKFYWHTDGQKFAIKSSLDRQDWLWCENVKWIDWLWMKFLHENFEWGSLAANWLIFRDKNFSLKKSYSDNGWNCYEFDESAFAGKLQKTISGTKNNCATPAKYPHR